MERDSVNKNVDGEKQMEKY